MALFSGHNAGEPHHDIRLAASMHPLLLGIFGGFLAGAGLTAEFERAAAREIASGLEGKPKVRVRTRASWGVVAGELVAVRIEASGFQTRELPFFTETRRSRAGKIGRVELSLKDFSLRGLTVKSLEATIPRCRYDRTLALTRKRFRLSESGEGRGTVQVEAAALTRFALTKFKGISQLAMTLENGRCLVEGEGDFFLFRGKFRADGRLASPDGRTLELVDATISLNDAPSTPALSQAVMKVLNPILDLDRDLGLYGALLVETIRLERGVLRAEGKARIPDLPSSFGD
jgi:hypothetical protein